MEENGQKAKSTNENLDKNSKHPIVISIDHALHSYRDIEAISRLLYRTLIVMQQNMWDASLIELKKASTIKDPDGIEYFSNEMPASSDEALLLIERLKESNLPSTLLTSLFLGLFSSFDAFTGNLLKSIYQKKPELLDTLNIEVPLSEILRYESFEDLKESVLNQEIEKFRRKSYVEQFDHLEKQFGINLKKFQNWSHFVEMGQRRNLITHCEGIVSKQYIKICNENKFELDSEIIEGKKLNIDYEYFTIACSLIYEVSLKLGQTLWRKIFPDENDEANEHLSQPIYESLRFERYDRAILLSEFAISVENKIKDLDRRIRVINYGIALKFSGNTEKCLEILEKEDWSACALDFRLAVSVLKNNFEEACKIMLQIGETGELIKKQSYHVWPLFREFRKSNIFLESYKTVYGSSFSEDVSEEVNKTEKPKSFEEPENQLETGAGENLPPFELIKHLIG
ncbi:hypothetical protein [Leptospira brenneri]|uniref:hypothetical protein n=1 Tax=Leptospira brenneri TaxID=2023182 RepID=UPI000C2AA37A|nr:hypothetical protein [Leptospira brenneri]PJZ43811.1 hypothetical protein CH361_18840 [Leptospira brenneri]